MICPGHKKMDCPEPPQQRSGGGYEREREPEAPSRADEVSEWRSGPRATPAPRESSFGGGRGGYEGGFSSERGPSTCFNCGESGMKCLGVLCLAKRTQIFQYSFDKCLQFGFLE